jgi:hypothetical protein
MIVFPFFRKLVLLKLEKGVEFGDAVQNGNNLANFDNKGDPSQIISTSVFQELEEKEKTVCVVSTPDLVRNYKKYYSTDEDDEKSCENEAVIFVESETSKCTMETSATSLSKNNLTICHLDAQTVEDGEKRVSKAKKWTKKMWSHTSTNGLFVVVWSGSPTSHAFIGMAINKNI